MDYQVLITKEEFLNVVGDRKDCVKDIEVVAFGSNKKIECLNIRAEDFKEENLILKVKPEYKDFKVSMNPITLIGKSISYRVMGFMLSFMFGDKKYYLRLSNAWFANADNRCFIFDLNLNNLFDIILEEFN